MLNTTQPSSNRPRSASQPAPKKHNILSDSDVQNRIATLQARERKQVKTALKNSRELEVLKTQIIDRWVDDKTAVQASGEPALIFSSCTLSARKKAKVVAFAHQHLAPTASDDATTQFIKLNTLSAELIEQCLGLKPLTMRTQDQGLLEMAVLLIEEVPMIDKTPEFERLKAAVANCPSDVGRAEIGIRARMKLVIAKAMQTLLADRPHRIATEDGIRGITQPDLHLCEADLQRFIGSVEHLVQDEATENIDLELLERFTPRLQKYVPRSMLADFDNFVDTLNHYEETRH